MPKLSEDAARRIQNVLASGAKDFVSLARTAGLRPDRDFRYVVLRDVDFSGSDLEGFDFTGSRFERCSFAGARLGAANFADADFSRSDLGEASDWSWQSIAAKNAAAEPDLHADDRTTYAEFPPSDQAIRSAVDEDVRRLEDAFGTPDWPAMFRAAWYAHRPDPRLVDVAQRWLKRDERAGAVTVLLPLLDESRLSPSAARWVRAFADDWVHRRDSMEGKWTKLWSRLLREPDRRPALLELGSTRLAELTKWAGNWRSSARPDVAWTSIWRQLSLHGVDPDFLETEARRGAERLSSAIFVTSVLLRLWQTSGRAWAEDALRTWLSRTDPRQRGWNAVLRALLDSEYPQDLLPLAREWLRRNLGAADWPAIWIAFMRIRSEAAEEGMEWLRSMHPSNPAWPTIVSVLIESGELPDSKELRSLATHWLEIGQQHPHRELIAAYVGGDPMLGQFLGGPLEQRLKLLRAFKHHIGQEIVEMGRNKFCAADGSMRFVVRMSKAYPRRGGARYWYGYYETVDAFLDREDSLLILGCLDRDDAFAIPCGFLRRLLPDLHRTERPPTASYWHLDLIESGGRFSLLVSKQGEMVPVDRFRFDIG
jgi:hypothetical protein